MTIDLGLPRAAWPAHPHWPDQLLLLGSHRNFRSISATLITRADDGAAPAGLLALFAHWKAAMRSHEHYEEHKLYPYLEHRFGGHGLTTEGMAEGHRALAAADRAVHEAIDGEALLDALIRHDAVLQTHLDHEESIVVPALLALSPEEFDAYTRRSLSWLLENHAPVG